MPKPPSYPPPRVARPPAPHPQKAVKYLKEMPVAGVPPTLKHFKLALKACETATSRALTGGGGGGGNGGASSPSSSSSAEASALLGERPGGSAGSGSGSGGGRQGWEADVAAAVASVPVIFELIRETADLSPDDDCYSSAMRCASACDRRTGRPADRPTGQDCVLRLRFGVCGCVFFSAFVTTLSKHACCCCCVFFFVFFHPLSRHAHLPFHALLCLPFSHISIHMARTVVATASALR